MSTGKRTSASGCLAAISSMSMPPSAENSSSGPLLAGSLSTAAYISRAIGTCASTSTVVDPVLADRHAEDGCGRGLGPPRRRPRA